MRFYQNQRRHTCGADLHGRNLYLCILDQQGQIRLHERLRCDPELFLQARALRLQHHLQFKSRRAAARWESFVPLTYGV